MTATTTKYSEQRVEIPSDLAGRWSIDDDELVVFLQGACPTCAHDTEWQEAKEGFVDAGVLGVRSIQSLLPEAELDGLTMRVTCNCQQVHEDRDNSKVSEGSRGCGSFWFVTASLEEDGAKLKPTAEPKLKTAVTAARYSANPELEKVRASAGKWIGGTAALFGLFSLSGTALGSDTIRKLTPGAVQLFVAFLGGAAVLAALAVLLGYRAAYGWPKNKDFSTDRAVLQRYQEWRKAPEKASSLLRASVLLGAVSLLCLIFVAILVRVAPLANTPGAVLRLTLSDQSQPCGTAIASTEDAVVRLRQADGTIVSSPASAIHRLESPAAC